MDAPKMDAMDALRKAVADKGAGYLATTTMTDNYGVDHPTPTCQYEKDGEASCIVGTALANMGAETDLLHRMDLCDEPQIETLMQTISAVLDGDPDADASAVEGITQGEMDWLMSIFEGPVLDAYSRAQDLQDRGQSWGAALANAEIVYARRKAGLPINLQ